MRFFGKRKFSALAGTILQIGLLIAFASQSFVTQTHIHASSLVASVPSQSNSKAPLDKDDAAHCPLCQTVAQSGHVLAPAPVALPAPHFLSIVTAQSIVKEPVLATSRHDWLGRAPPYA